MASPAFPIVGIGASAGGIEALEHFFRGMPEAPGLGFVILTHLRPQRESHLHEVVARYSNLPVRIAADGVQVAPNFIYVLPPDAILSIEGGRLVIQRQNAVRRERNPIDVFFSALAMDQGELAAGVVLSGSNSDGTLGIKAIKEGGGLTLAQTGDRNGLYHPEMPESAIATGLVDFALPAGEMANRLIEFARGVDMFEGTTFAPDAIDDGLALDGPRREIYAILRNRIGHDFSGYKTKTFLRRVRRRMQVAQLSTAEAYVAQLQKDPHEVGALFRDLLINVTNFFRDEDAFETLASTVVPKLFEGRSADDTVRVWVPGCATGEEVYSIGILLREYMDTLLALPRVQIFATDIDDHALEVARAGRYPRALLNGVSPERRQRFFILDGASYVIAKEIRELCVFSTHSLIRDPPFSRIDLISCRNLLIYFGLDVQNEVIPTFHYALMPDGFLFLGLSENISQHDQLFKPFEKKHRIFCRRQEAMPGVRLPMTVDALRPGQAVWFPPQKNGRGGLALRQIVESQVLDQFAPPHVVVNREGEVVYYSARTGKYLEAAAGAPTRQIMTMARKGLRLDMRATFRETLVTGRALTRESIAMEVDADRVQMVTLTVAPLQGDDDREPLFLVLFRDEGLALTREESLSREHIAHDAEMLQLENELRDTRERLQSLIEEYETALEDLKASNEELVSVNEELQSTNEELEASKEELRSLNEELHTVNAELADKVDALDRANNDLKHLFESTDVATIFLDKRKLIRDFTTAATKVFNLQPSDRGRPITDFASRFGLPDFDNDIADVLSDGQPHDRRVDQDNGKVNYLVKLAPYRGGDQKIEGVVASFVDVSILAEAERRQLVLISELRHRTRNLLTVVQSIAKQTIGKGRSIEAFAARLGALGRVQGLIGQALGDHVALGEIVRLELQPHAAGAEGRIVVAGPLVALRLEYVQTIALALHELTTNAVAHGALKDGNGRLDVRWEIEHNKDETTLLVLNWLERGVAMPATPPERGYGRELIERALSFALRAKTDLTFGTDGISCRIEMPLPPQHISR